MYSVLHYGKDCWFTYTRLHVLFVLYYLTYIDLMTPRSDVYTNHRDTYLEQQETEKIETKVIDFVRILITEVYACCPVWHSGGS